MSKPTPPPTPTHLTDTGELFQEAAAKGAVAFALTCGVWILRKVGPGRRFMAWKATRASERAVKKAAADQVELDAGREAVLDRAKRLKVPVPIKVTSNRLGGLTVTYSTGTTSHFFNGHQARLGAVDQIPSVALNSYSHMPNPRPVAVKDWSRATVDKWMAANPEPTV